MEGGHPPAGWDREAHALWLDGARPQALRALFVRINAFGARKPLPLALQAAYYFALTGDHAAATGVLEAVRPFYPDDRQLLRNLGFCLSARRRDEAALEPLRRALALDPEDFAALDTLCSALAALGRLEEAAAAGTASLIAKDRRAGEGGGAGRPERVRPRPGTVDVIAFSLWGDNPRYLRGAVDNARAAPVLYPGRRVRFHLDGSVPSPVVEDLRRLDCEIVEEPMGRPVREKLAWRFKAANDPKVGRFLVRDADSVPGERERAAVAEWEASGLPFHVMRDWWSHTDLILAGMWGGIAGLLPDLSALLAAYRPPDMETANIDQWFLRDRVWPLIRGAVLVHDRCFTPPGARPWPLPPPPGDFHVGQDASVVARRSESATALPTPP